MRENSDIHMSDRSGLSLSHLYYIGLTIYEFRPKNITEKQNVKVYNEVNLHIEKRILYLSKHQRRWAGSKVESDSHLKALLSATEREGIY